MIGVAFIRHFLLWRKSLGLHLTLSSIVAIEKFKKDD